MANMTTKPDFWNWRSGMVLETTERSGNRRVPATVTVDEVIKGRSDLVKNGTLTVSEWLSEARDLWQRDHP